MALRRRGIALCLAALGGLSLAITYVIPVAATLAAGGATISPLRELDTPTLELPSLRIPSATRAAPVPPLAAIHPAVPRTSTRAPVGRHLVRVPVVTSSYVT